MQLQHDPALVALSLLVAVQASFVSLILGARVQLAFAQHRRALIAGAALSLGIGIWAMHFVGMLAAKMPFAVNYLVLPTLLSFLVCVLVVGFAIYLAVLRSDRMLLVAAMVMGIGITSMHYIGMHALHSSVHMIHSPVFVLASVLIAIIASGLSLWLAFASETRSSLLICAMVLGCAIAGMHYTAMAGLTLVPIDAIKPGPAPAISEDLLAVMVSVVAFLVSASFLLALVPDRPVSRVDATTWTETDSGAAVPNPTHPRDDPESEMSPPDLLSLSRNTAPVPASSTTFRESSLPIGKSGSTRKIDIADVFSVHADAHYTYVFNGREDLFCPLSISETMQKLPPDVFFRSHRSYIVNVQRILRLKRVGDNGVAELNSPIRRSVPVSRSQLAPLKTRIMECVASGED